MVVHPMLKKRKLEGEYWTLFKELFIHFRMSRYQFDILINEIELLITKQNNLFKVARSAKEKLTVY